MRVQAPSARASGRVPLSACAIIITITITITIIITTPPTGRNTTEICCMC